MTDYHALTVKLEGMAAEARERYRLRTFEIGLVEAAAAIRALLGQCEAQRLACERAAIAVEHAAAKCEGLEQKLAAAWPLQAAER